MAIAASLTERNAANDAAQIDPDGNPRTAIIEWIALPLWFRADRVIVIYVSSDQAGIAILA